MADRPGPLRYILGIWLTAWGAVYILGPAEWSSSSTFVVLRGVAPVPTLSWVLVSLGVLLLVLPRWYCYLVAAMAVLLWGVGLAMAARTGELTGAGGVVHAWMLAITLLSKMVAHLPRARPRPVR